MPKERKEEGAKHQGWAGTIERAGVLRKRRGPDHHSPPRQYARKGVAHTAEDNAQAAASSAQGKGFKRKLSGRGDMGRLISQNDMGEPKAGYDDQKDASDKNGDDDGMRLKKRVKTG